MKIVKFQAENVKKIKAVEITPDNNTVVVSGRNGQGKTSILDSIWLALGGGEATKGIDKPIRNGEKSAMVALDLGEYKVTRSWTANDKSYLKVETQDGAKFPSPQKLLDALIGRLSFDPLAFSNMDDKSQRKTLLGLVELPVDPAVIDQEKAEIYEERTLVNRDAKQLEAQLEGLPDYGPDAPTEEISSESVLNELQQASDQLTANNLKRQELESKLNEHRNLKNDIDLLLAKISDLQSELVQKQENMTKVTAEGKKLRETVDSLVDPELSSFQEKLRTLETTNNLVRMTKQRIAVETSLAEKTAESKKLTEQIAGLEKKKSDMLKKAQFPVDGLGFDEEGVTFGGIPFKQCSSAERLRVSVAMAMALNPKLRVIRIMDGSLLDSTNMKLIEEMAKDNDYQVWIEVVDESGKLGVYIEDGEVVENV